MRLTDEKIADVKEYLNRSIKVTASSLIPQLSKYGIDLIDTIEALQQENEQLKKQIEASDTVLKKYCRNITEYLMALAKARQALKGVNVVRCPYCWGKETHSDKCEISKAITAIDKALGGKEDAGNK